MGLYNKLEEAGYTDIVQTSTLIWWDLAVKMAAHGAPITTKAEYYAKKGNRCFRVVVEYYYRNRSSELSHSYIGSEKSVTAVEYDTAVAKIGPDHLHKRY